MTDITEKLIVILEDLYAREKQSDEIVGVLQGHRTGGPGFLNTPISELEHLIVQYLGGKRWNLYYCRELDIGLDPFANLEEGIITRTEFIKQVKRIIKLDLKPEFQKI